MKSLFASFLLTFFFGPFGNFYSSIMAGFFMLLITVLLSGATAGVGALIMWPICIAVGLGTTADSNNAFKSEEAKQEKRHQELLEAARIHAQA
jgi:hypothetical protein